MRKFVHIYMILAIALILGACSGEASKEEVINSIEEKMGEVEKYHVDLKLDFEITDANGNTVNDTESILKVNLNEATLENSGERIQNGQKLKYYSTEEATYTQLNDGPWEDKTTEEEQFNNFTVFIAFHYYS